MTQARLVIVAVLGALAVGACAHETDPARNPVPDEQRRRVVLFWDRLNAATAARIGGDCARARDLYLEALRLDPKHEDCLYYLGQCHRELKQPAEARRSFERLVEVNPASARGHLALGALLASSDPGEPLDLQTAEAHLRRAHEINGEETAPMVRLGEVLIVRGQAQDARSWLEAAARTNPKSVEAAFLAGYLLWEAGDRQGAEACLRKALQASRTEGPPKGVLGEGDLQLRSAGEVKAAPPLQAPMGRTLFSELSKPLRSPNVEAAVAQADQLYSTVRRARSQIRRRNAVESPADPSSR